MNNERNNRIRNAGFLATAGLAIAMLGGACTSEVRPSNNPGATATELATATPDTSAAAGSASPEGLVMPSAAPEATSKQEIVSVKDGSVAVNTIIKLPANTVITGDPFFFGGQPGSGQQLEDYQKIEFQVEQIKTQSLVNGQTLTDSRPESGSVWVLKQAMDIQSAPSYGFSWNTLQNADMAEKFALGQQFVTEFLGCGVNDQGQKGCQRVDVIHVPGEMQGPDGPTPVDGTNPSQSPMPSQEPNSSLMPTASEIPTASQMPLGNVDLGSMTKDQEILFLENLINSGKVDMNSETGKTLANLLYCLECTSNVCETPTATPTLAPTPKPKESTGVCVPTEKDIEQKAGYTFDTHGQSIIIEGTATIDGKQAFTKNSPYKQIDVLADGKNHHVVIGYPDAPKNKKIADVQYFNSCADKQFILDTEKHDLATDNRILDPKSIKLIK